MSSRCTTSASKPGVPEPWGELIQLPFGQVSAPGESIVVTGDDDPVPSGDAAATAPLPRGQIKLRPLGRDQANAYIRRWHRHNAPVKGHKFAIAAVVARRVVGVVVVGRPSARALDDGATFEVTRLATPDGALPNVASKLLGAAWRTASAMGVTRLVSYTRADERGACYRAAGWKPVAPVRARAWSRAARPAPWLPGFETPAAAVVERVRWERRA